jgi:antitoxin (DNA-binding transcriptional repressor) of toxin-antitoxin stability system
MVTTLTATAAKRQFLKLLERANQGETFLVTRYGKPAMLIEPPDPEISSPVGEDTKP